MTDIRFTPAARSQLLETLAELRDLDRCQALSLVDRMTDTLLNLADDEEEGDELVLSEAAAARGGGHRFYCRLRDHTLWVIAVWPEEG